MKVANGAEVLADFERARRDDRTSRDDRRVLAQTQRLGRVGDLKTLALSCQLGRARLDACLARLAKFGYLAGPSAQDVSTPRETRSHDDIAA